MNPLIEIESLDKDFRAWFDRPTKMKQLLVSLLKGKPHIGKVQNVAVLQDINFKIYPGEFIGIMGRNGAGKSTLFKILAGIYTPSRGSVNIRGTVLPLIELGAGFHPDLSGYENIFLNSAILGVGRAATLKTLNSVLEFSELGDHIHMPVRNYSSGMLVRLGFSIACHLPGEILLVDEVLAVGDMGFQQKCLDKIRAMNAAGRTIILVTHSPDSVLANCSRCIVLEDKRVYFDGNAKDGVENYMKLVSGH